MSDVAEVLALVAGEHRPVGTPRHLTMVCSCGWSTQDAYAAEALHAAHVAEAQAAALAPLFDTARREAWDEGWCAGGSNVFLLSGESALPQNNPYDAAEQPGEA